MSLAGEQDIEYRGVLIDGGDGDLQVDGDGQVTGLGVARSSTIVVAGNVASVPSTIQLLPRVVTVPLLARDDEARADVRALTVPGAPEAFTWRGYGHDGDRLIYAAPTAATTVTDLETVIADEWRYEAEFTAYDPRVYEITETTTANVDDTAGGFEIDNDGTYPAPFRFTVAGPFTDGRIRNIDTGDAWRWPDLVVTSGQTLTVDFRTGEAWITEVGEDPISVWHLAETDGGGVPPARLYVAPGGTPYGWAVDTGTDEATIYSRSCWL